MNLGIAEWRYGEAHISQVRKFGPWAPGEISGIPEVGDLQISFVDDLDA